MVSLWAVETRICISYTRELAWSALFAFACLAISKFARITPIASYCPRFKSSLTVETINVQPWLKIVFARCADLAIFFFIMIIGVCCHDNEVSACGAVLA